MRGLIPRLSHSLTSEQIRGGGTKGGAGGAAGTQCGLHPWAGPNCGLRVGPMAQHNRPGRSWGTTTPMGLSTARLAPKPSQQP